GVQHRPDHLGDRRDRHRRRPAGRADLGFAAGCGLYLGAAHRLPGAGRVRGALRRGGAGAARRGPDPALTGRASRAVACAASPDRSAPVPRRSPRRCSAPTGLGSAGASAGTWTRTSAASGTGGVRSASPRCRRRSRFRALPAGPAGAPSKCVPMGPAAPPLQVGGFRTVGNRVEDGVDSRAGAAGTAGRRPPLYGRRFGGSAMGWVRAGGVAVLAVRVGVGATSFAHGAQKLFGWFGGGGLEGTAKGFEGMGYRPGESTALAAGLSEAAGGASLALGLATPAGAAAVAGAMGVAAEMHSGN